MEVNENNDLYINYKAISNLPFVNPEYIFDIYDKIENYCKIYNYEHFLKFLEYFKKTYLLSYDVKHWNYYDNISYITNNTSESFNNYLNNLFSKKPSFYKLISTLQKEESLSSNDYKRRDGGSWDKKKIKKNKTDEIDSIVGKYKEKEYKLINNGNDRKTITELWYQCLIDLNKKITN